MSKYRVNELNKIKRRLEEISESTREEHIKKRALVLKKQVDLEKALLNRFRKVKEEFKSLEKELLKTHHIIIESFKGIVIWEMKGEEYVRTIRPKSKKGREVLAKDKKRKSK